MEANDAPLCFIWGIDHVAYGPVELPTIVSWIRDERVLPESWVYDQRATRWSPASEVTELKGMFRKKADPAAAPPTRPAIKSGSLRRIKILAEFADDQLASFARYLDVMPVSQYAQVVTAGEKGDSMFMVLEGELRVRVMVDGRESTIATLEAGESFGELALMDEGVRSADVIANKDSVLLSISNDGLKKLFQEAPALAAPFLHSLARMTAARLRQTNRKVEDSIRFGGRAAAITGQG